MKTDKYVEKRYDSPGSAETRTRPEPGEMQVICYDGEPQAVDFLCPCGCGENYYLQLVTSKRKRPTPYPVWDYHEKGHMIHPSVRYKAGCLSHFYVNLDGTVQWT